VIQTPIAVTLLHKIHYGIEVLKKNKKTSDYWFSKYNRILHHYSVSIAAAAAAALCYRKCRHNRTWRKSCDRKWRQSCDRKWRQSCDRKWRHNRKWRQSRDRQWPHNRSDVSYVTESDVTGIDVIFPRFFLIIVVQNVPLLFIIRFTVSDYSFGSFPCRDIL
jgi:hypothetical protein